MTGTAMSTAQIKRELGVDERTLHRWRKAGCPSRPGKGKAVVYDLEEVRAWMRQVGRTGDAGGSPDERTGKGETLPPGGSGEADEEGNLSGASTAQLRAKLLVARVRKETVQAERHLLELEARRGQVLPRAEVVQVISSVIAEARDAFEDIPGRVALRLVDQKYDTIRDVLEREIRGTLTRLADGLSGVGATPPR